MTAKKPRIFVVDDEKELNNLYKERLEMEGYEVFSFYDGDQALEQVHLLKPDLILLDIMMPTVSGSEVLELLKSNPATKEIPVIMLTALPGPEKKSKEAGANDYMVKAESSLTDIVNKVNSWFKGKK